MAHPIETLQPHGSGDFLSEKIDLRSVQNQEIIDSDTRYDRDNGIQRFKHRFTMDNDIVYNATIMTPPEHSKVSALHLSHTETTAWLTGERGMNEHYQRNLARTGITAIIVSIPQNLGKLSTLTDNSLSQLAIHQELAELYQIDPAHILSGGISNGGMHGNGVVRFAPYYGSKVIYANNDAPGFADGLSLSPEVIDIGKDLLKNEPTTLTAIREVPLKALSHYPKTLALSPANIIRHLQMLPALFSGETGEHARNLPEDTFMYVTGYKGDAVSQMEKWEAIYEPYENIIVENLAGGGHLSCVGRAAHVNKLGRTKTVLETIKDNPRLLGMGGTALRTAAMERNPVFNKSIRTPRSTVVQVD